MSLISLLIVLLVFCVILWAARYIMSATSAPEPIPAIVTVVIVLLFLLWLLGNIGLLSGGPIVRFR